MFARTAKVVSVAARSTTRQATTSAGAPAVAVVDGIRLPFKTSGSDYNDLMAYDLMKMAYKGLMDKTALDVNSVDYVLAGTVVQEVRTSNLAREASIGAGFPVTCPSHTVTQACISANQAICTGAEKILSGRADIVVAGGAETFSDVPIRFSRPIRKRLLKANKALKAGPMGAVGLLKGLKAKDLAPEPPAIRNFLTSEIMGSSSDRLAARFGVSRAEQDEFALRSHQLAGKAHDEGMYKGEIVPYQGSTVENGIRADSKLEKLASMKPAFIKPHGTHTAANSSFLTDGAAATLIMSEAKCRELGYAPKAFLREWTFVSVDPFEDLLLGPAYAISKVLRDAGLELGDIDVLEIHEAFAGQVLANINALGSDVFGKEQLGRDKKVGDVDFSKLNLWGGSLAVGHPFGATGARLVNTASNRLHAEGGKYALLAACADSGLAHCALLERAE